MKVLIIVDYQYDFVSPKGDLYVPGAEDISKNIQKLIDSDFDKIIYTMDTHDSSYSKSEESKLFPEHCMFNTKGWDLYKIKPKNREIKTIIENGVFESPKDFSIENEFVFMKDKFSIWEGNKSYTKFMRTNIDKDSEIFVCGVATNYCVFQNIVGLIDRGYKNINIVSNAVKGIPDETYKKSIQFMKSSDINFMEV